MSWRFLSLRLLSVLMLIFLIGRLAQLQLIKGNVFRDRATRNTIRTDYVSPIRGEIFASDGKTLLASSVPSFHIAVRYDLLPDDRDHQEEIFAHLAQLLSLDDTVILSPTAALDTRPGLEDELRKLLTYSAAPTSVIAPELTLGEPTQPTTITVIPERTMDALLLTRAYSDVLNYRSAVEQIMKRADLPHYLPVIIKSNMRRDIALTLRENQSVLPGVVVIQGYQREYPLSSELPSLSHVLGFTGRISPEEFVEYNPVSTTSTLQSYLENDLVGKDGIELEYEQDLRGVLGVKQLQVDVNQVAVGEPFMLRETEDGNNVVLTIDLQLQRHVEATLRKWLEESDRRRRLLHPEYPTIDEGVIIIMDVNTGSILAMSSLPAYDNNLMTRPLSEEDVKYLFQNERIPMLNRAIGGIYEPGSTFKQVSATAALYADVIDPDTRFHDPGVLIVENVYDPSKTFRWPNAIPGDRGMINVVDALKNSSNVFFQEVSGGTKYVKNLRPTDPLTDLGVGHVMLAEVAKEQFGLGQRTGVDLPGEVSGLIPTEEWLANKEPVGETWSVGHTYNMAIGQGNVLLTPLQMLNVTATIANGGTRYRPHVTKAITAQDGSIVRRIQPEAQGTLKLLPEELSAIKDGMYRSVHDKDAHNVQVMAKRPDILRLYDQLRLAGKTGTAEYEEYYKVSEKTETSEEKWLPRKRSHSWFVGFAPYENPQIAAIAFLAGTGDLQDGSGTLTLPAVAEAMAPYFSVTPLPTPTPTRR